MSSIPLDQKPTLTSVEWPLPDDLSPAWVRSITDDGPIELSVCIANWNCRQQLRDCLESLHDQPQGVRLETVVVDNASSDGAAEMVARDFPEVVLLRNLTNRGFSAANNQAAALARGRYLLFLNNDTIVPAGVLRQLLDFAQNNPGIGMIGPRLRDAAGQLQVSYRNRPTLAALLHRTTLFRWTGLFRRAYRRYRRETFDPNALRRVDVLMGAAVLLPREVFFATGGWDEDFTFGGEDIDLSVRVGRQYPVVFLPTVEITHLGRTSTRQNVSYTTPNVAAGFVHCLRKAGSSPMSLFVYKAVVSLDAPLSLLTKLFQTLWRRGRGQSEKAARSWLAVRGLWHFCRSGLPKFWRA